jgi:hypothetical protein
MSQLMTQIHDAADHSLDKATAAGMLYHCLKSAIECAREDPDGFGSCSTGDVLSVANLDDKCGTLIDAEFYIRHAEYRDKEAFKK